MNENEPKTKVIFRIWNGEVVALFPEIPGDITGRYILCFDHIGGHSSALYNPAIDHSHPATEAEYSALKTELETYYHYDLQVYQRRSPEMRRAMYDELQALGFSHLN